jgi:hypothetical protein
MAPIESEHDGPGPGLGPARASAAQRRPTARTSTVRSSSSSRSQRRRRRQASLLLPAPREGRTLSARRKRGAGLPYPPRSVRPAAWSGVEGGRRRGRGVLIPSPVPSPAASLVVRWPLGTLCCLCLCRGSCVSPVNLAWR